MLLKIPKITTVAISTLILLVFFSGFSQFGMGMDMSGKMIGCPFAGHRMSVCKMNPMDHIQEWQSIFTTLSTQDTLSLLSALLALLALFAFGAWRKFRIHDRLWSEVRTHHWYPTRYQIFDPFKEAFSRGILNPKLFYLLKLKNLHE